MSHSVRGSAKHLRYATTEVRIMNKRRTIYWRINSTFRRIGYVELSADNTAVETITLDPQVRSNQLLLDLLRRQFE